MITAAGRALLLVCYKPSGSCSKRLVPCAVIACVLAFLAAAGYQEILPLLLKSRQISFFVFISAGVFGTIVYVATLLSRLRNASLGVGVGVTAAMLFLATSQTLAGARAVRAGAPADLVDNTLWRLTQGVQTARSTYASKRTVSGWELAGYWGIEAMLFLGLGSLAGMSASREPFCERCGKRASKQLWKRTVAKVSPAGLRRMKNAQTIGDLVAADPEPSAARSRPVVFTANACKDCGELMVFSVTVPSTGGMFSFNGGSRELHENLLLDPERKHALLAGLDERGSPVATEASKTPSA